MPAGEFSPEGMRRPLTANDEAGRHRAFLAYVLLFATLYAGFGVMSPFLPALLQSRGLRPEDIGLALALTTIVRLVTGPVAGRVADRLGALRSVFAASATAAAICGLGLLSAHGFFQVVGVSVLYAAPRMARPLRSRSFHFPVIDTGGGALARGRQAVSQYMPRR